MSAHDFRSSASSSRRCRAVELHQELRFDKRGSAFMSTSTRIELTLACGDYEIMRALKEGTVRPDGIDLKVVTAMDSPTRHWRFLRGHEFEIAEVSGASDIAARDNGHPFRAIPVFP